MKKTFYITREYFTPDGSMPGSLRIYKVQAETLEEALKQPTEGQEEQVLPDGLREMYRISVWV